MKSYPYIYSLSTVGLIHHYNNDYLFNRVRTDFTGDSGTGKSMIADLLQLIFVGSTDFEAATESIDEKRRPKGMVLTDRKRGLSGKGYAFLNIALELQQYLVIGVYLEQSTNQARPFIIFQGYDSENPEFMQRPLSHTAFLDMPNILSLEDLKKDLTTKGLNCEVTNLNAYHRFLYQQQILPFDLADNPAKLKAYALIIQSFSRGKGFKFDTKNLQDFLFGTSAEKTILTIYQQQIENLNTTLADSLNYKKQIAELTKKKIAILDIIRLDRERIAAIRIFLECKHRYITQQLEENLLLLQQHTPQLIDASYRTVLLQAVDVSSRRDDILRQLKTVKEFQMEQNGETSLDKWAGDALEALVIEKGQKEKLDKITAIMGDFGFSIADVSQQHTLQSANKSERSALDNFVGKLRERGILKTFEESLWKSDYKQALKNYHLELAELNSAINSNTALMKFSNVDDPHSIAHWAINTDKALTHDQESLLIKYKELIVDEPAVREDRYLPKPNLLFEDLDIEDDLRDETGFWISIQGIYEYIPLVSERFLDSDDPASKKEYFTARHATAKAELNSANKSKEILEDFHRELHGISGLEESLELYARIDEIESYIPIPGLSVETSVLESMLDFYSNSDEIEERFNTAERNYKSANQKLQAFKNSYSVLSKIKDIESHRKNLQDDLKEIEEELHWLERKRLRTARLVPDGKSATTSAEIAELLLQQSVANVMAKVAAQQTILNTKCRGLREHSKKLSAEQAELLLEMEDNGIQPIQGTELPVYTQEEILQMHDNSESCNGAYRFAVNTLINTFLADDSYKYADEQNWKRIARALLPELFKSDDISEEQLSSEVEEKLQNIIDKNRIIGDRKVQMLLEVFGKVETYFTAFSTEIDRLRVFFNGNDKRITGGHKVVIKSNPSTDYPISWITEFKKRIREENTNRTGLFKIADDAIDFKEIILQSFRQCGGKKSDPKIEDLLNPKKYFELSFSLQKDNIKSSGSTGQVYTAIALLCIARISLIEQEQGNRKRKGVRFMPVDEAEGLGSNYEMLSNIAKSEDYQIISMSINPVGEFETGSHYIYMLNEPEDEEIRINGMPFAQFTEDGITSNINSLTGTA